MMETVKTPCQWPSEPNYAMHQGPGYLGDAPHCLRKREVFKYFQPPPEDELIHVGPLNTADGYLVDDSNLSPNFTSSHDPILACLANLVARKLDAKRCIVSMTAADTSYVVAESTRSLSLAYPHTHDPGDQLFLGAGTVTTSIGGLCEHTVSLIPPSSECQEPLLLQIADLREHPKYQHAAYVQNWPHGRFYAGAPIRTRNGVSIGTLCVLDDKPRPLGLTEMEVMEMSTLADLFMSYLELKQVDRDKNRTKLMEIELSRFISEGILPADGAYMAERRDGTLLNESILEQRRLKEIERRKKVEERRQMFQEREFAKMARREKLREKERKARMGSRVEAANPGAAAASTLDVPNEGRATKYSQVPWPDPAIVAFGHTMKQHSTGVDIPNASSETDEEDLSLIDTIMDRSKSPSPSESTQSTDSTRSTPSSTASAHLGWLNPPKLLLPSDSSVASSLSRPSTPASLSFQITHPTKQCSTSPSTNSTCSPLFSHISDATKSTNSSSIPVAIITDTGNDTGPSTGSISECEVHSLRSSYEQSSMEPDFRAIFTRAATIIRNVVDANVVFVDADLEGFFGPTGQAAESPGICDWGSSYISTDADAEATTRTQRPISVRRISGILAYATSGGSSPPRSKPCSAIGSVENLGFDMSELSEDTLSRLVRENKEGEIVSFDGPYPGLEEAECPNSRLTESILQKFLPGCRNVIIVPLLDYNRKLFAVSFVWTCSSTRSFCGDAEGRFVTAVSSSITAEVMRLNILNADKAKSEFISSISHELRSPIHGILASADFLSESNLDAYQMSFVETIIFCATTLLHTVNHVLDFQKLNILRNQKLLQFDIPSQAPDRSFSSIDTSKKNIGPGHITTTSLTDVPTSLQLIDIDLSELVQDVTEGVYQGYGFRGLPNAGLSSLEACGNTAGQQTPKVSVILDIDKSEHGWTFKANPAALRRIINNLLGNSLKYNKDDGWVRISLSSETIPGSQLSRVKISVADSGKGISREFMKTRLFTPFCQENPLSSGAGLGMSIVRQLVDMMGGKIDVKSKVGQGTTVNVEIPLSEVSHSQKDKKKAKTVHMRSPSDGGVSLVTPEIDLVRGRKAQLIGFCHRATRRPSSTSAQTAGEYLLRSVKNYCKDHFGIILVENTGNADIVIVNELTQSTKTSIQSIPLNIPVVVLCTQLPVDCGVVPKLISGRNPNSVMFLRKPCAPKKFAVAMRFCADLLEGRMGSSGLMNSKPSSPGHSAMFNNRRYSTTQVGIPQLSPSVAWPAIESVPTPSQRTKGVSPLPVASQEAINSAGTAPSQPSYLAGDINPCKPTVLAVEDNQINMKLLTTYLRKHGYPYDTAYDGREALNAVKARRGEGGYDVILMDLQMPVLSGIDSTREIRTLESTDPELYKRSFIVALTGLATMNDRRDAFSAGVDAFMVKPANFKELENLIEDGLAERASGTARNGEVSPR